MPKIKIQDIEAAIDMHHKLTDGLNSEAFIRYSEIVLTALKEKIKRDNATCENCRHIMGSKGDGYWCGDSSGLDGDRRLSDFCSYFKIKEMPA